MTEPHVIPSVTESRTGELRARLAALQEFTGREQRRLAEVEALLTLLDERLHRLELAQAPDERECVELHQCLLALESTRRRTIQDELQTFYESEILPRLVREERRSGLDRRTGPDRRQGGDALPPAP